MKFNKNTDTIKYNVFSSFFNYEALISAIEGCDESKCSIAVTLAINKRTRQAAFKVLRTAWFTVYFLLTTEHNIFILYSN